jgi:hypothetical protein
LGGVSGGLALVVKANVEAAMQKLIDDIGPVVEQAMADSATVQQLRGPQRRAAIESIADAVDRAIAETIDEMLTVESCFEMWQPEVVITIPLEGPSSVSIDGFVNPVLAVSGGLTTDTRPGQE